MFTRQKWLAGASPSETNSEAESEAGCKRVSFPLLHRRGRVLPPYAARLIRVAALNQIYCSARRFADNSTTIGSGFGP
jgi:hypothetical protein